MAGYVSIETIVPCRDAETFHDIVQRYLQVLISMEIGEPVLLKWGQSLPWLAPDGQREAEWPRLCLKEQSESFEARLALYLWVEADESREKLILSLDFDLEKAIGPGAPFVPHQMFYKRAFGQLVWRIMQAVFAQVPGYGCYLADEGSQGLLIAMEQGQERAFWNVSLGMVPCEIYERFLPVPDWVVMQHSNERGIFATRGHWEVLPWEA